MASEDVEGHKWKKMPKGWTSKSRKKFWDSLTSRAPKHKVKQCIKRMEGKVDDPGAFCASLADRVIPGWRQEAAKERRKKKAYAAYRRGLRSLKMAAEELGQPLRSRRDYGETREVDLDSPAHSLLPGADEAAIKKASKEWITYSEMQTLCPPCAARMKKANLSKVHAVVLERLLKNRS